MSNLDKELSNLVTTLSKGIKRLFSMALKGGKQLNRKKNLIAFGLTAAFSILTYWGRYFVLLQLQNQFGFSTILKDLIYLILLTLPFWFLVMLGFIHITNQQKYQERFEKIGFKSRMGKFPILEYEGIDKLKQQIYQFRSEISLSQWEKNIEDLQMIFDCNITEIKNTNSKQVVKLTTIPSAFRLPGDQEGDAPLYWDDKYLSSMNGEIVLGISYKGQIKFNLNTSPHVLAAGETGSGKSVVLQCCLWQLINQGAKVIMIDFKGGVEFGIDHEQYGEVITDRKRAAEVLKEVVEENERRLKMFRSSRAKNLLKYNKKYGKNLSRIGIFCDEIGEMLDKKGKGKEEKKIYEELESYISSIARLGRAAGINLFLGVQRPDANIITGQIKSNVPVRICGRFADRVSSEIVLRSAAATTLPLVNGRFIFQLGSEMAHMQAYFFEDDKVISQGVKSKLPLASKEAVSVAKKQRYSPETVPDCSYQETEFNFDFDQDEIKWSVDE